MNLENFEIKSIEVERFQLKDVLRSLINTIVFNRALGSGVVAKEVDCEVFEQISYVKVDDVAINKQIETDIETFCQTLEKEGKGVLCLSFYAKSVKKGWLSKTEEKTTWERWLINLSLERQTNKNAIERDKRNASRQEQLRERLMYVVAMVNEKKDHIPPLNKGVDVFPFMISHSGGDRDPHHDSWSASLTRILKQGPPLLMKPA